MKKEIIIREGQEPIIVEVNEKKESPAKRLRKQSNITLKILLALLGAVILTAYYASSIGYTFSDLGFWFSTKLTGKGVGEGYPQAIVGNVIEQKNVDVYIGDLLTLTDTSLSVHDKTGSTETLLKHNYTNPVFKQSKDNFLLYGINETGYTLADFYGNYVRKESEYDIIAGDISHTGRYALATSSQDFSSEFNVYLSDGSLKFSYKFADTYISAVAFNPDSSGGAVSVLYSDDGILSSEIYIFDFNIPDPLKIYTSTDNMVTNISYNSDTDIVAIGDNKALIVTGSSYSEYDYAGKSLSAVSVANNLTVLSLSKSVSAGECTIALFGVDGYHTSMVSDTYVDYVSAYGATFSILSDAKVSSFDLNTNLLGTIDASFDTSMILLANESDVYMVGTSQILFDTLEPIPITDSQ